MRVYVIYDSFFGNTKEVAKAVGEAFKSEDECIVQHVSNVDVEVVSKADLLFIGSPTRGFEPTKPIVGMMKVLLQKSTNTPIAVFDTRIDVKKVNNFVLTFLEKRRGNACSTFEKMIQKAGGHLIVQPEGFYVAESEGPLDQGEIERATTWARQVKEKILRT